jgi:hypothetical protein
MGKVFGKINEESSSKNLLNNLDSITLRSDLSIYRKILFEEFEEHNVFTVVKNIKKIKTWKKWQIYWKYYILSVRHKVIPLKN